MGRFIQPDTIIPDVYNPQALNHYSYVLNNPLRYVDPSGHKSVTYSIGFTDCPKAGICADYIGETRYDNYNEVPSPEAHYADLREKAQSEIVLLSGEATAVYGVPAVAGMVGGQQAEKLGWFGSLIYNAADILGTLKELGRTDEEKLKGKYVDFVTRLFKMINDAEKEDNPDEKALLYDDVERYLQESGQSRFPSYYSAYAFPHEDRGFFNKLGSYISAGFGSNSIGHKKTSSTGVTWYSYYSGGGKYWSTIDRSGGLTNYIDDDDN